MKYFNTEGRCSPRLHYMVNLEPRLELIKKRYIMHGSYFAINRGRQYGKTTTLRQLQEYLKSDYTALFMDFQKIGSEEFLNDRVFIRAFTQVLLTAFDHAGTNPDAAFLKPLAEYSKEASKETELYSLRELFIRLSRVCADAPKPVVLMIDETDSASNSQVFIDFLAMLRAYYLERDNSPIFHSVILAGVYDIKNLKLKIRPQKEHQYNSPWNIAADFDVAMFFSAEQIAGMLEEYETDNETGMDVREIAAEIYDYTSGYPYLVSAVCRIIDERLPGSERFPDSRAAWTKAGISEAVSRILSEQMPLFQSMVRQFDEHPEIKQMFKNILFQGKRVTYNPYSKVINIATMFGYIVNSDGSIQAANRIFEMWLYNLFLSEEELTDAMYDKAQENYSMFISNGKLNMKLVLEKFCEHFTEIYGGSSEKFVEDYGRKFFLLYLKPIINGTGNYYIEAQTRSARRTDVIVDYLGEQFIIELKIWRGSEYHERGEAQLSGYLDEYHQKTGYLISFNFNKNKQCGVKELQIGDKVIIEAVV